MLTSWVRKAGLALCAATIAIPGIAEAGIIVGSSGPSASKYTVGNKIADNATVTLKDGDAVTVLVNGSTRVLRGPGTFRVSGIGGTSRRSTFAALVKPRGATRVRPGAVRGTGETGKPRSPNLWYLDADQGGTFCLFDVNSIRLWRSDLAAQASYRVSAGNGSGMSIDFPDGEMLAAWDDTAMPVSDGASFSIEKAGASPTSVTFALLSEQPDTPEAAATALIERGCSNQLTLLTDTLAVGDDATSW